jgi:hypothetical protein
MRSTFMSYNYVVVDSVGSLINRSFQYSKSFIAISSIKSTALAYLLLTVRTGYSDLSENAVVSINGTKIGNIEPHPWTNAFNFDTITLTFPHTVLIPSPLSFPLPFPLIQTLRIVPQGDLNDANNYLLVMQVICHYIQEG